jgi:hypothetical protein
MRVRLLAVATIVLIGGYLVFRVVVSSCTGATCDAYIPASLLLPLSILVLAGVTGVSATSLARGDRGWVIALLAATLLGTVGPLAALAVLRDKPDILVPLFFALELLAAMTVLAFSALDGRPGRLPER